MLTPENLHMLRHHPDPEIADTEAQQTILYLLDDIDRYRKRVEQDAERIRILRLALEVSGWDCHACGYVGESTGQEYCVHCGEEFPPPNPDATCAPCACGSTEFEDSCPECGEVGPFGAVDEQTEEWALRVRNWHRKVILERGKVRWRRDVENAPKDGTPILGEFERFGSRVRIEATWQSLGGYWGTFTDATFEARHLVGFAAINPPKGLQ